jgi:hypothetical protein
MDEFHNAKRRGVDTNLLDHTEVSRGLGLGWQQFICYLQQIICYPKQVSNHTH